MGQYHKVVNLDKREFLNPRKFGDGRKLMEFADSSSGTMTALAILLACSNGRGGGDCQDHPMVGRWAGDRIAIVGDYGETGDLPQERADVIYQLCASDEERLESVAWCQKMAGESRAPGRNKEFLERARLLAEGTLYKDISDEIVPLVEAECQVTIQGEVR